MNRRTVILLGASNLTIGWRPLLLALRSTVDEPIDLHVATGMGRSYCDWSSFWFRRLQAITACGLWAHLDSTRDLQASPDEAPLVLLTDVGNDIVYGQTPETIAQHVEECITRILAWRPAARIVMTGLPMVSVSAITRTQFLIARSILFPFCFLSLDTIQRRSSELDEAVRSLAARFSIPVVTPERHWYSHDPIHVLKDLRQNVFKLYLSNWRLPIVTRHELSREAVPALPAAALSTRFRFPIRKAQPSFESQQMTISVW